MEPITVYNIWIYYRTNDKYSHFEKHFYEELCYDFVIFFKEKNDRCAAEFFATHRSFSEYQYLIFDVLL